MTRILFVLLVVAAVFAMDTDAASAQRCGRNEVYNSCGSACPPSCNNRRPQFCTMQCVAGCQCKSGYLRNNAGQCVPPYRC